MNTTELFKRISFIKRMINRTDKNGISDFTTISKIYSITLLDNIYRLFEVYNGISYKRIESKNVKDIFDYILNNF